MTLPAKIDSRWVQVERGVMFWLQRARQVTGPTAVAATHLEYIFFAQFHLRGDVMIQLDAGAVRFIAGRERYAQWRLFLVGVVEKQNLLAVQPPREKRIPELPDGFANPADGEQVINDRHAQQLREMASDANLVRW